MQRRDSSQLLFDFARTPASAPALTLVEPPPAERAPVAARPVLPPRPAYGPRTDDPKVRLTVVWPPPSPYGEFPAPRPGPDSFADELFALEPTADDFDESRPRTRGDCYGKPRPCPWVSCRYNLYLDVREDGGLKLNFPDKEPDEITASCALDLAEDGSRTLDGIAALMGMSKERARQLEARGLGKMRDGLPRRDDVTRLDDTDWI